MKSCVVNFVVLLTAVCSAQRVIGNLEEIFRRLEKNPDLRNLNDLYRSSTGTLYSFHSECRNYEDAKRTCEQNGGHLAVVNNEAEANLLAAIFQRYPPESLQCESELYLGVHYTVIGNYVTYGGETLEEAGYAKWADGEPNNLTYYSSAGEECITFFRNKRLNDLYCGHLRPSVCEIPGYVYKSESDSRYMLHLNRYRPGRAAQVCQSHGGHLASIDNSAEALLMKEFIPAVYQKSYADLFKLKHPYVLVDFHFERNDAFSYELDVTYNQEPRYIANNCSAIDAQGNALGVSCSQENFFICEIDHNDYDKIKNFDLIV